MCPVPGTVGWLGYFHLRDADDKDDDKDLPSGSLRQA